MSQPLPDLRDIQQRSYEHLLCEVRKMRSHAQATRVSTQADDNLGDVDDELRQAIEHLVVAEGYMKAVVRGDE